MGIDDKRRTDAERQEKRRQRLASIGIKPMTVQFPESDRPLIRDLSRRVLGGEPVRQAMRALGGSNEPEPGEASAELLAELEAARQRFAAVEREADKRRTELEAAKARERALQADLDAARASEAEGQAKVQATTLEAEEATKAAQAATQRAEAAETAIGQAKALPGFKGRLVRWLAGDILD